MTNRPIGISIISFLYIIKGLIDAVTIFTAKRGLNQFEVLFDHFWWIALVLIGIALNFNKKWVWWVSSTIISFSVLFNLYQFLMFVLTFQEIAPLTYKILINAIIQGVILVYLFQKSVFDYFKMDYLTFHKKLKKLVIINIVFFVVIVFIQFNQ